MKRFFLTLLISFIGSSVFAQYVELSGVVTNNEGEPIARAVVSLSSGAKNKVLTDADGVFKFRSLAPGKWQVKVSFMGYETYVETINLQQSKSLEIIMKPTSILTGEVLVLATRGSDKATMAKTTVSKEEISTQNIGQDIPYLLTMTPSYVASSDAGAGVGYTNFRIRGTDATRINITIDGIPVNDAESQGTFFVNTPNLAGSLEDIQVQRGVGSSTNGAAAFGGTVNMQTAHSKNNPEASYHSSVGSFGTFKNSVSASTGKLGNFSFDLSLSKITSDGFVDRASSDLKSFYASAMYSKQNTAIKFKVFSGLQTTYQAWNGVPSVKLNNDAEGMKRYQDHWLWSGSERENKIRYDKLVSSNARTYNFYTYDNEVDHYRQNYYQLHLLHQLNHNWNISMASFLTQGQGYYETYKYDRSYKDYQMLAPQGHEKTDLVQRKWLDNYFYGGTYALNFDNGKNALTFGGAYSIYDGDHFGNVIWAQYMGENQKNHEWYRGTGVKKDFNTYLKYIINLSSKFSAYADMQYRHIDYKITGIDDNLLDISQKHKFNFLNPKIGFHYQLNQKSNIYASYAMAHREPNRTNFVDAEPGQVPTPERLNDIETGYNFKGQKFSSGINLYGMFYKDQLVLTGEINDVGSAIMTNVDDSYRIGAELTASVMLHKNIRWDVAYTLSSNKIKDFTEYVDNWDADEPIVNKLGTTNLAFSPNHILNSMLTYELMKNFKVALNTSYVGEQFINNSSSRDKMLDAWFVNNLKVDYSVSTKLIKEMKFHLMVNNIFDVDYETNAWVYSYHVGGENYKMDGYFPQAGINFLLGVDFKF